MALTFSLLQRLLIPKSLGNELRVEVVRRLGKLHRVKVHGPSLCIPAAKEHTSSEIQSKGCTITCSAHVGQGGSGSGGRCPAWGEGSKSGRGLPQRRQHIVVTYMTALRPENKTADDFLFTSKQLTEKPRKKRTLAVDSTSTLQARDETDSPLGDQKYLG